MLTAITAVEKQKSYGMALVLFLALMPLIAVISPRFLAYWPGIVGLCLFFTYKPVFGRKPEIPKKLFLWILGIVSLGVVSCFWALDPEFALCRAFKMALILFGGATLVSVTISVPLKYVEPFLKYLLWGLAGAALLCGFDMTADYPVYRLLHGMSSQDEVSASSLNRCVIALLSVFFTAAAVAHFSKDKTMLLGLFVIFGFMIFFTDSQSAQLGFILALILFLIFPYAHKAAWYGAAGILSLGVLSAPFLAAWMFDHFAEAITTMPFLGSGGGFGGQRLEIWDEVGRYALQRPLYGFGLEATRAVESFDSAQMYRESTTELHPHNFAIQLWIEFGVIGALLGVGFFISLFKNLSTYSFHQARIALPTFMILLTVGTFAYGLWQSWFLGLIIFTIAVVRLGIRLYEKDS